MELGLNLPYVEASMDARTPRWTNILRMAQAAASIGFDALWVSDHVASAIPSASGARTPSRAPRCSRQ